jgi:hypothetical protein
LGYLLVFTLSIVGEPTSDLLPGQASLAGQLGFIGFLQVGVVNVVQEPLLEDLGLVLLEGLT